MKLNKIILSSFAASVLMFSGCTQLEDEVTAAVADAVTLSGKAVDGYLRNSFICIDKNNNSECDDGEPYAKSSSDGSYSIDYSIATNSDGATVLVVGGVDDATGEPFTGLLRAPLDTTVTTINITPLSTIVAAKIEESGGSVSNTAAIAAAQAEVATTLGLSVADLNSDPVANTNENVLKQALQIQKVIEVMTQAQRSSDNSADNAEAAKAIAQALAKQFNGTAKDVSTIIQDVADANDSTLQNALAVAVTAKALATTIETQATGADLQAVADILVDQVVSSVEASRSFDANGSVVIDTTAINAISVSGIDVSTSGILAANVDRMLMLMGYSASETASLTNKAALITLASSITSSTTLEEIRTLIAASTLSNKLELLSKIDLAVIIEEGLGQETDISALEDKNYFDARIKTENNATGVGYVVLNKTAKTIDAHALTLTDGAWVDTVVSLMGDDGGGVMTVWNGTAFVDVNSSAAASYTINTDGSISMLLGEAPFQKVTLKAVIDLEGKTIQEGNVSVTYSAGAEAYLLGMEMHSDLVMARDMTNDMFDGTTYSSFNEGLTAMYTNNWLSADPATTTTGLLNGQDGPQGSWKFVEAYGKTIFLVTMFTESDDGMTSMGIMYHDNKFYGVWGDAIGVDMPNMGDDGDQRQLNRVAMNDFLEASGVTVDLPAE